MGSNWPELLFVITVASILGIIGVGVLICWTCAVLALMAEARRWKRSAATERAREEINHRELLRAIRASKQTDETYWANIVGEIDKEYRGN